MTTDRYDLFTHFAERCELRIEVEDVASAPRDVLAPPTDLEWCTVATLATVHPGSPEIDTVFVSDASDRRPPTMRDVLWWLASDCWAIERSNREMRSWAGTYHHPHDHAATERLFNLHRDRADTLVSILGREAYSELLSVYEAEVASTG